MKKFLTITSRSLFALVLLFCIFKSFTILADTSIFQITKIEVKDKSEGVVVNDVSLSNGSLNNDIIFSGKDDYVKYNITIKNTSNDNYTIKSITDNNDSTNLEYTYEDLTNVVVESKTERTFELQIKYIEETTGLYISNKPVSLTLTYEKKDGSTGSETITNNDGTSSTVTPASDLSEEDEDIVNPNTGDNLNIYIILGLISLAGLGLTFVNKKSYFKTLMFISLFSILAIPFGAKADSEKFVITFTTNKIQNTSTDLISGPEFNLLMNKLSSGKTNVSFYSYTEDSYWYKNTYYHVIDNDSGNYLDAYRIHSFTKATPEQFELIKNSLTEENIISTPESNNPAYMWYEPINEWEGRIYYYSSSKVLVMNEDSSLMFLNLKLYYESDELDLSSFDTIKVKNMSYMFSGSVVDLTLGNNFDTSKVTDMSYMFSSIILDFTEFSLGNKFDTSNVINMSNMFSGIYAYNIDLGDNFDTSKVTDMSYMFSCAHLQELNLGNKFDTSSVTTMAHMFSDMEMLEELDLGDNFDTSNVIDMSFMFGIYGDWTSGITTLNLGDNFDTSNVIRMDSMFNSLDKVQELDLGNKFDTSNVVDMSEMFRAMYNLQFLNLGDKFNTSKVTNMDEMFAYMENLEAIYVSYDFDLSSLETSNNMFYYDNLLVGEYGTTYSKSHINSEYAHIDNIIDNNYGYFSFNPSDDVYGKLISGPEFNLKLHKLSTGNDNLEINYDEYEGIRYPQIINPNTHEYINSNYNAYAIRRASFEDLKTAMASLSFTSDNKISTNDSDRPIIMWFDNNTGTIYYYSSAKILLVNEDASIMFNGMSNVHTLDFGNNFDTSNVTNMFSMFGNMGGLNKLNLGQNFDTSKVTNMMGMFGYMYNLSLLDLGDKFDTSKVTNMSYMFSATNNLQRLDLGDKFDTSKVTDMSYMFAGIGLNTLDLGNKFNTSKVLNMEGMFCSTYILEELDLGQHFDTSKVMDMAYMFAGSNLGTIYVASDFDLSSLELDDEMFAEIYDLIGGSGTTYDYEHIDATYARIDDPDNGKPGYFTLGDYSETVSQSKLVSGPEINILIHRLSSGYEHLELVLEEQYGQSQYVYIDNVAGESYYYSNQVYVFERANKRMYNSVKDSLTEANVISTADSEYPTYLWRDDDSGIIYIYTQAKKLVLNENSSFMFFHLSSIEYIDMSIFDTSQVTDMSYMFSGDESLEEIYFGSNFNTSNVTNMSHMFEDTWLEELNLSSFDTSKVTDMSYMFSTNENLQELNLGDKFDTSSVINMEGMFSNTYGLEELNLGNNFNTLNVTNMAYMFSGSNLKSLDLGENFDTSNVTNMEGMFNFLLYLRTLDLGDKFDTSKVTNMSYMFSGGGDDWYSMEELILGDKFDTSKVTDMSYMFYNNRSLTELDLGDKFNTSKVTNMTYMFGAMANLTTIYSANDFDLSSLEDESSGYYMFGSSNLVGGSGTSCDYNNNDASYARIDDPEHDRPGYFTLRQN